MNPNTRSINISTGTVDAYTGATHQGVQKPIGLGMPGPMRPVSLPAPIRPVDTPGPMKPLSPPMGSRGIVAPNPIIDIFDFAGVSIDEILEAMDRHQGKRHSESKEIQENIERAHMGLPPILNASLEAHIA